MRRKFQPRVLLIWMMATVLAACHLPVSESSQTQTPTVLAATVSATQTPMVPAVTVPAVSPQATSAKKILPTRTPPAARNGPAPITTPSGSVSAPPLGPTADLPAEVQTCSGHTQAVALVIDPALYTGIQTGFTQFETDLCQAGYDVYQRRADFATPPDVREYLAGLYSRTKHQLIGAILIGNLPHAYQWVTLHSANPNIPSTSEEIISFQYYSDLNGTFAASPNYQATAQHPFSYDQHTGDVSWEIWIGVLPYYKGDGAATVDALNRYFAKNHAYRTGQSTLPRAFLEVSQFFTATTQAQYQSFLSSMQSAQTGWSPFSNAANAHLYFGSASPQISVDQGYAALSSGEADFVALDSHGNWRSSGKIDISWVESHPVKTSFLWSGGCAVGDLDYPDNFLTSALYSPTSSVVVAKGTTNDSGGFGINQNGYFGHNIATSLTRGESLGQAILDHVNVPLLSYELQDREFLLGSAVVLGDPTLGLHK